MLNSRANGNRQMQKGFIIIRAAIILILMAMVLGRPFIGIAFSGQHGVLKPFHFQPLPLFMIRFRSQAALAKGRFLVASRHLLDPNFSETVVLLIDYDRNGAMGLVINRPTKVKLSMVFPEMEGLEQRTDTVYMGGPVARNQVLLLVRANNQPEESRRVIKNIFVSSSLKTLKQMIDNTVPEKKFHVYAGYAGWAAGQLNHEVSRGDWHILPADAETVFEKSPSDIWPELIHRSSVEWVKLRERPRNAVSHITLD